MNSSGVTQLGLLQCFKRYVSVRRSVIPSIHHCDAQNLRWACTLVADMTLWLVPNLADYSECTSVTIALYVSHLDGTLVATSVASGL